MASLGGETSNATQATAGQSSSLHDSTTMLPTLKFVPLPAPLSTAALQPSTTVEVSVDKENAYPCRRCLTDGHLHEQMLLLAYDPFVGDSPYRGAGPVFVHRDPCAPYRETTVPEQQRRRLLSLRAYDARHMMVAADVMEGGGLEGVARRMLQDAKVEYLHVHNAKPGCFAVRVERG